MCTWSLLSVFQLVSHCSEFTIWYDFFSYVLFICIVHVGIHVILTVCACCMDFCLFVLFISSCDEETFLKPLLLFDSDQSVEDSRDGHSFSNVIECKLILEICNLLLGKNLPHANIGIITPYRAQTKLIQSSLERRYWYIHMCMTLRGNYHTLWQGC